MKPFFSEGQLAANFSPWLLVGLCLLAQACTLKTPQQDPVIKLRFSKENAQKLSRQISSSLARHRSLLSPSASNELKFAFSEFNCFGILVTGAGISGDSRLGCPSATGILGGMVPASGGDIEISVPAGPERKVRVFAVRSAVGCPNWDTLLGRSESTRYNGIDKPYEIGSSTLDIFSDVTVSIRANYDPAAPVEAFPGCAVGQSNYGQPLNATGIATFTGGTAIGSPASCHSNKGRPCLAAKYALDSFSIAGGQAVPPSSPSTVQKYNLQFGLLTTGLE